MPSTVLKALIDARAVITKREHWTIGLRRMPILSGGYAYCALGAIEAALNISSLDYGWHHDEYTDACRILAANLENRSYTGPHIMINENLIAEYNNNHTHKEVLAWFDRAIANQRLIEGLITIEPVRELEDA